MEFQYKALELADTGSNREIRGVGKDPDSHSMTDGSWVCALIGAIDVSLSTLHEEVKACLMH